MYPAGSINPASQPQGGAEFYASPLEGMAKARQMVLTYSVFFPVDFNWVRGGKLPGLYGGRSHCSGGDDATDCFSGAGELYLYAPKDKQTSELCGDHQSVCESTYGLSIGRGSFNFNPGSWTHLKQTVALNRPGKPDGYFALDVDGKRVIERSDIYYRGMPAPTKTDRLLNCLSNSTFFGGHEQKFATPRDQYTWFKDFSMSY
ncbi:polysaccharide lyase family 14 protein [Pleurotus eryngii]|uniref:Polysaccharide lyase family 14 protein n=1 Tax=Pleurotus eryngii TaxID=5323 RepID=A0A9P5ZXH5_PLEER|nr:polysaccharide lyase family 14 protein [Pleurotus eryngii]